MIGSGGPEVGEATLIAFAIRIPGPRGELGEESGHYMSPPWLTPVRVIEQDP